MDRPSNFKRSARTLGLVLIGFFVGGAQAVSLQSPTPTASAQAPPPQLDSFLGVVIPSSSVDLSSKFEGRLERLDVRVGDAVEAGQIVAHLDARPLQQALDGARASLLGAQAEQRAAQVALAEAREKYARYSQPRLLQLGVFSQEEVSAARFQAESAAARVSSARAQCEEKAARVKELTQNLSEAELTSPFEGIVAATPLSVGAHVAASQRVLVIQGDGPRKVRFAIPEEQAREVHPGAPARVEVPQRNLVLEGTIETVAPEVDAAARMVFAVVRFDKDGDAAHHLPEDLSTGEGVRIRTGGRAQAVPTRSIP